MVRRPVQAPGPVLEPVSSAVPAPADSCNGGRVGVGRPGRTCWPTWRCALLVEEAELTPKPALVDRRGGGAHEDMDLAMMRRSANALRPTFRGPGHPSPPLRAEQAAYARSWPRSVGVARGRCSPSPVASTRTVARSGRWACSPPPRLWRRPTPPPSGLAALAGRVAAFPDRYAPPEASHGSLAATRYGVAGARGEARHGFPHVVGVALPALRARPRAGRSERVARLDALVALIAHVDDTCLLHRGGRAALRAAQERSPSGARRSAAHATAAGRRALRSLEAACWCHNASPGGSADLLAAALFLDALDRASCVASSSRR